ncbi:MAG: DNA polymerase-1, partial [Pirellulaceae bacterium]
GRELAMLSRELVRLDVNVPIEIDWAAGRVGGVNQDRIQELCNEYGFRSLGDRMSSLAVANAPAEWHCDYQLISNDAELEDLVNQLRQQKRISIDTETTNALPRFAELVGYSFSWEEGVAYYVPVQAPAGEPCLDAEHVRALLKPILEDPSIKKIGQNIKYDMLVLRSIDIDVQGVFLDTMVADYLLAPGERNHSIDDLAKRYLNHNNVSIKELIGTGKKQISMAEVPVAEVAQYAAEDADVPFRLAPILEARLKRQQLDELYFDLEVPLLDVLAEMEWNGIEVNRKRLEELSHEFGSQLDTLEDEIYEIAGGSFNIDSRQQLGKILFEDLELPVIKKTKSGPSTDVDVLSELAKKHPLPAKIIEYRQFAKLKSTYVDALQGLIHPATNRVHTSFKQDVAATGRLSSKDPNLQNIPVRTESGRAIRSAFQPGFEGWKLLTADYSQIELRVLAHFSQDETLQRAFAQDQDIHQLVASEVYGVTVDDVTSDMRRAAKAINFGIIYGQTPFGLAKALDISKDEAAEFIAAYLAKYPGVEEFMEEVLDQCSIDNYVSTILGRKREVSGVRNAMRRGVLRTMPERIAINTVIQGSAADLIKIAMLRLYKRLKDENLQTNMLLQIHDELIFEVSEEQVDELATIVVEEMSGVYELTVPLKVDVSVGDNWAACQKWTAPPTMRIDRQ